MATTGGWQGLWNRVYGANHALLVPHDYNDAGGTLMVRGHAAARRISKIARTQGGMIAGERVFDDLNEDYLHVTAVPQPGNPAVNGGRVTVGTKQNIPMTITNFTQAVEKSNTVRNYPVDRSGNGGGGKMGIRI